MMLEALENSGYELRRYQSKAAQDAFVQLKQGNNVEIDLPTGTGKSLIANQVSWLWLSRFKRSRVLYVVPRRILVDQHQAFAKWMAPAFLTIGLAQESLRNPLKFRGIVYAHRIVISTPKLLSNAIKSARFPRERFNEISLIVVDEYDAFLVPDYTESDIYARWHRDWRELLYLVPRSTRFLLLSATSPLTSKQRGSSDRVAGLFADFINRELSPASIEVDPEAYGKYVPTASVTFLLVSDSYVLSVNEALKWEIQDAIGQFEERFNVEIDRDYLFSRLEGIIRFKVKMIQVYENGRPIFMPVNEAIKDVCYRLRNILNKYGFLFEDMFEGFSVYWEKVKVMIQGEFKTVNRPYLLDQRADNSFQVRLQTKSSLLKILVDQRAGQRGVIFTRFQRLSDAIFPALADLGMPLFKIDARLSDTERAQTLARFKETPSGLLVITRDTGKRGLDLPQADYAIFYSPKSREYSAWQELSRIRSNVDRTKESVFLCYKATSEEERARELGRQMKLSRRQYEIDFVG